MGTAIVGSGRAVAVTFQIAVVPERWGQLGWTTIRFLTYPETEGAARKSALAVPPVHHPNWHEKSVRELLSSHLGNVEELLLDF
ncbi:MAG: hypothetical protein IT427_01825 [Pirellulales bacterium]|nr:hypothetical protein [Pirellulales bacterium]